jgi:hypothetical protein
MNQEEFEAKLVKEFPNLYKNMRGDPRVTCMAWGIDVSPGWFDIIYELSQKLEAMILNLPEEVRADCCAAQVKEKFGGLRFYMDAANEEMRALIRTAEEHSYQTCETCGKPGIPIQEGWFYTSCKEHAKEHHKHKFQT